MFKSVLLLAAFAALSAPALAEDFSCQDGTYDWPNADNCRYYYHCEGGKRTDEACFVLFRKFDPATLTCNWAWRVDCTAKPFTAPPTPPTSSPKPPTPVTTPKPTEQPKH